ncbi:MAG: CoA-binding protein [Desulfurococcaceae archaeon TW002]
MSLTLAEVFKSIESIAVVGGSPVRGKIGNVILENILRYGFNGKIYVINPKYDSVLGIKSYKNLKELPEKPDIVIVAVPADAAVQVVEEAALARVKLAVVISSGFSEEERHNLQERLEEIVKSYKIRVVGPNSAGITLSNFSLHANIEVPPTRGSVGVAAQSGAVGGVVISELKKYSSGISFFVSLGNCADVSPEEVLEYAAEDKNTDALILYLEWLRDGRKFVGNGLKLLKTMKPLCVIKGGVGKQSSEAVRSHTGGLTPSYEVFRTAVSKIRGYLAIEIQDAVEVCELTRRLRGLNPSRILIVTNSGGLGVLAASHLDLGGFEIPKPPPKLIETLSRLGLRGVASNPLDLGGDTYIETLADILTLSELREYYDLAVLAYVPTAAETPEKITRVIEEKQPCFSLPVIGYFAGEGSYEIITRTSKYLPIVSSSWILSRALIFMREFNKGLKS